MPWRSGDAASSFAGLDVAGASVVPPCPLDVDPSGDVGVGDLLAVLGGWGDCPQPCPPTCVGDVDDDCVIGVADLLAVLGAWGDCPE